MPDALSEFFHMGGYARYVWTAYAVTFVVLAANILLARIGHKKLVQRLSLERRSLLQQASAGDTGTRQGTNPSTKVTEQ